MKVVNFTSLVTADLEQFIEDMENPLQMPLLLLSTVAHPVADTELAPYVHAVAPSWVQLYDPRSWLDPLSVLGASPGDPVLLSSEEVLAIWFGIQLSGTAARTRDPTVAEKIREGKITLRCRIEPYSFWQSRAEDAASFSVYMRECLHVYSRFSALRNAVQVLRRNGIEVSSVDRQVARNWNQKAEELAQMRRKLVYP